MSGVILSGIKICSRILRDFSGETSLKQWYSKVQKGYIHCAQEHAHYYGNCTYDDAATYDSGMFLLRMYLLTLDPKYKYPVERCLDFVLESQYPIGGWPQRYPLHYEYVKGDKEDYTSFITINDGVHTNNINFLLACYTLLGETRALEPLQRAMTCVLALQGGKPQAGWAMQHKLDLNYSPGHARDFEPAGYAAVPLWKNSIVPLSEIMRRWRDLRVKKTLKRGTVTRSNSAKHLLL